MEPPGLEAWPRRPTERPTGRPGRETRPEPPGPGLPPWSSEEDLVAASPSSKVLVFCHLHVTLIQNKKLKTSACCISDTCILVSDSLTLQTEHLFKSDMETILSQLLEPDNEVIKAATIQLRSAFKQPGVIPELCSVLRQEAYINTFFTLS